MTRDISNQIVGVCRFSYAGEGGFAASTRPLWELEAMLYDPMRMKQRFALFETICLPSLANQTDPDFKLIALIADTMPYRWRRRLKDLMAVYPFLQVCTLEAAGPLNSTRRAFRRGWDRKSAFITGFRIDDDDAVACDYIAKTRALAHQFLDMGWADADHPVAIAFHRGIYWSIHDPERPFWEFSEIGPLGLASAMITPNESLANIYRWNHRKVASFVRTWCDPEEMMFVRSLHGVNDSDRSIPPGALPMERADAQEILRKRFGLQPLKTLAALERLRDAAIQAEEDRAAAESEAAQGQVPLDEAFDPGDDLDDLEEPSL